jgi:hypothetical protein
MARAWESGSLNHCQHGNTNRVTRPEQLWPENTFLWPGQRTSFVSGLNPDSITRVCHTVENFGSKRFGTVELAYCSAGQLVGQSQRLQVAICHCGNLPLWQCKNDRLVFRRPFPVWIENFRNSMVNLGIRNSD